MIGGLVTGGRKGNVQGGAAADERNAESDVPQMSDGRNDAVQANENAPARTRPAIDNHLPPKLPVLSTGSFHVGGYS